MATKSTITLWTLRLTRAGVATVFVWAGLVKAFDAASFEADVERYRIVPGWLALFVASYFPWLEIVAGGALFVARVARGAELILLALLGIFLAALVSAWTRGLDINCGCFGQSGAVQKNYMMLLLRDVILGIAVFMLFYHARTQVQAMKKFS
jgi:putative oxidoreductase